jgi:hypothetical protein
MNPWKLFSTAMNKRKKRNRKKKRMKMGYSNQGFCHNIKS